LKLPSHVAETNSVDICSSASLEAPKGYLRSPSYPEAPSQYSPKRQLCQCQVRAAVSDSSQRSSTTVVTARILDLSLALPVGSTPALGSDGSVSDEDNSCHSNYLHVTGLDRRCAGHATPDLPETVDVDVGSGETLVVEFRSEPGRQQLDRGFWIDFNSRLQHFVR
jgi:hypothetical protein